MSESRPVCVVATTVSLVLVAVAAGMACSPPEPDLCPACAQNAPALVDGGQANEGGAATTNDGGGAGADAAAGDDDADDVDDVDDVGDAKDDDDDDGKD